MKQLIAFGLLLALTVGSMAAKDKDKIQVDCFARVVANPNAVIIGDSLLVSYVVYASAPVGEVKGPDRVKVKGAGVRRLPVNARTAQSRVVENGRMYYTKVWAQYVVAPEDLGTLTIPAVEAEVTFRFRKSSGDPWADFFRENSEIVEVTKKVKNEPLKVEVKEKPRRTSRELMRDGLM